MGYVFEHLVRRFNEQANEEAGDHFTPREVIRLMAHLVYTGEEDVYRPGIFRTIYDPACGTGGMLSVSEEYIREHNAQGATSTLFGQDYNDEVLGDLLLGHADQGRAVDNIVLGDTLGDGKTRDGFEGKPSTTCWPIRRSAWSGRSRRTFVEKEHDTWASPAASGRACRASTTARCCSSCT